MGKEKNMRKLIDCRGMACPQPVVETKKMLDKKESNEFETIVDNKAARENIKKFCKNYNAKITEIIEEKGIYRIFIETNNDLVVKQDEEMNLNTYQCEIPEIKSGKQIKKVFITTNQLGTGSEELGSNLMTGFIYTLNELATKPEMILFMNSGVRLCLKDAPTIKSLKKLDESGVKILVCGTCLDYYHLTEELGIGKISNMYEITENLMESDFVLKI